MQKQGVYLGAGGEEGRGRERTIRPSNYIYVLEAQETSGRPGVGNEGAKPVGEGVDGQLGGEDEREEDVELRANDPTGEQHATNTWPARDKHVPST
jgi:hypothetical protein